MGGNGEPSDRAAGERGDVDGAHEDAAQFHVGQRAAAGVEGHVVGRQARILPVAGGEPGIVAERLGVGGEQIEGEREPPGEELAADLLGRDAEAKNDSVAARVPLAPVVRVALELEPPAGIEADDAEGAGADGPLGPLIRGRAHRAGALREDRGRRVGDDGREEGDGLLEVDEELARREDVEALEVGGFAGDEPPGAADGRQQPPVHGLRHQKPLQEKRTSRAVRRRPSWNRTPGRSRNRYCFPSLSVNTSEAIQGTMRVPSSARVSVSKRLGDTSLCSRVSQRAGSRLRTTPAMGTFRIPPLARAPGARSADASAFPSSA